MSLFGAGKEYVKALRRSRREMTVCIGAVCNQKRLPGAIMLAQDLRVTFTRFNNQIVGAHDLTSKTFDLPFGLFRTSRGDNASL